MAVVPRSPGTRGTTSIGVSSGTTTNDLVLIKVAGQINTPGTVPSCSTGGTFNVLGPAIAGTTTGRYTAILWRFATTSESGSYTIGAPSGGTVATAEAIAYTGVDTASSPYLATGSALAGATASSSASPAVSGTIATTNDYAVVATATSGVAVTISTPPSGLTEIGATASSIMHVFGGALSSGASGSLSATLSSAVTNRSAVLVALPVAATSVNATVTAVVATTALAAPAPVVSGQRAATVAAVVATATLAAPAPAVSATRSPTVAAPVATTALAAPTPTVSVPLGALVEYNANPLVPEVIDFGNYDLSDTNKITVILDFVLMDPADSGAHVMLEHSVSSSANNGFVLFTESIFATPSLGQLGSSVSGIGRDYGDYTRPTTAVQHRMVWTIDRTLSFAHDLWVDGTHITLTQNATYNVAQASTSFGSFHLYAGGRAGGSFLSHVKMNTPLILHHIADSTEIASYFQADVTTAAVKATIATAAPTPVISAAANILAVAATVAAVAIAPSVTATRSPTVTAPASTITLAAPAPVVTGQRSATTVAVPATINLAAPAPAVTFTANPTVTSPAATITLLASVPSVSAGGSSIVSVPAATTSLAAPAPVVSGVRTASVAGVPAASNIGAPAPVVTGTSSPTVVAPAAAINTSAAAPSVSAGVSVNITAVRATVATAAPAPVVATHAAAATPPAERIYTIAAADRTYVVETSDRTVTVPASSRVIGIRP